MKKLLLLCACLAFTLVTYSQTPDKKWNIGLHVGLTQYKGDLGNDFYKTDMPAYGMGGISISRYIVRHFDLNFFATKGKFGFSRENGNFRRDVTTAMLNFRFNILGPKSLIRPYVFVGGGAVLFDKNLEITEKKMDYIAPSGGAGLNFRLGPSVMLNIQETFLYTDSDNRDGFIADENDAYLFHSLGFTFNFGKKKDADKDDVVDRLDKCHDTPLSVAVDKAGCPLDKDNDGVADYLDACADVAGTKALNGCPDRDGDNIADKDDRCPDVAGSDALVGCPDTDGDNVVDIDDNCPGTIAGYIVDMAGCPLDNDKDGIVNEEDTCPDHAGALAFNGCPDGDSDGVADNKDRCPTMKGTIANKGCPEIEEEDVKKITKIASKIFFETNSDKLKVASLAQLDELTSILKKYEASNLLIEGHADSQGDDAYNLELSQKRTESVKNYLMEQGILESRLTGKGFGESVPIADNGTSTGRAKNRRVELKTSY